MSWRLNHRNLKLDGEIFEKNVNQMDFKKNDDCKNILFQANYCLNNLNDINNDGCILVIKKYFKNCINNYKLS